MLRDYGIPEKYILEKILDLGSDMQEIERYRQEEQ